MGNVFGLGSILLWQWLTVLKGHLFVPFSKGGFPAPGTGYAFFSLVLCGTFFVLSRWRPLAPERWFRAGMWGAAAVMSIAWLPCGTWVRDLPAVGTFLFLGLPAVGSAVQLTGWEWRLCSAPFSRQASCFGFACIARTGGILLVSLFFPPLLSVLAIALPFLGASLWTLPQALPELRDPLSPPARGKRSFPLRLVPRIWSFFVVSAMFLSVLLDRQTERMSLAKVLADPFYSLGALGVALVLCRFPGQDLRKIYFGAEASLGLGFLVFAALGESHPLLPLALLQLGAGIFGAYIFTLLLYLGARAGAGASLSVVTTGQMVVTGSVLSGLVLVKAVDLLARRQGIPFVLTVSLLGVGLLFFAGLFFRDDRESFAGYDLYDGDEAVPESPRESEDVLQLNLLETLSRQEIRVALLVSQGLSNEEISRNLNITGNTVRTHLKNVHRKMGSANRKELQERLQQLGRQPQQRAGGVGGASSAS